MKVKIRYGGAVRCEEVLVTEGEFHGECRETFVSYSIPSFTRDQAKNEGWRVRVPAKLVKWRGDPPCGPGKKVDLCPGHAHLVMTDEEYAKHKKVEREKRKAERAELRKVNAQHKREQKAAAKAAAKAKADKAKKKPKAKKKSKAKKKTAGEAAPF